MEHDAKRLRQSPHHLSMQSAPPPPPPEQQQQHQQQQQQHQHQGQLHQQQHLHHLHNQQQPHQQQHRYAGPVNGWQQHDYRASPTSNSHPIASSSSSSSASMSLPPIQHFEPAQTTVQSQPQHIPSTSHINGTAVATHPQMHAPPYQTNPYQYHNGPAVPPTMPSNAPSSQNGMPVRYVLPPQPQLDPRQMAGGRHKKEIKRRTKTGCLTCRKRRIKCDEAQPSCKNCAKSKRQCLGYDPIFKTQTSPAPIQPAPSSASPSQPADSGTPPPLPQDPYNAFVNSTPTFAPQSTPPTPHHPHVPANPPIDAPFAYNAAPLDPALSGDNTRLPIPHPNYAVHLETARKMKPLNIESLFERDNVPPPFSPGHPPKSAIITADRQEMTDFFTFHYAPALDKLLETTWYSSRGVTHLSSDAILSEFMLFCMARFGSSDAEPNYNQATVSLEAALVWHLAAMPRHALGSSGVTPDAQLIELYSRIDTLEYLLTGRFLETSRLPPPPSPPFEAGTNLKHTEQSFWHELGRFISLRDDSGNPTVLKDIADILAPMRTNLLNLQENRDVLYSIAICRHIGGRSPTWDPTQPHQSQTYGLGDDEVSKLRVAHQFVQAEDQRGTNQVIQRICGMALRSWALQQQP